MLFCIISLQNYREGCAATFGSIRLFLHIEPTIVTNMSFRVLYFQLFVCHYSFFLLFLLYKWVITVNWIYK